MPWNNGVFERYNGEFAGNAVWQNDRDADYEIEANRHDAHDQDLALGINACLPRDGSAAMVADLNMGGFRLNNLAPGQLGDEIALFGQTIQGVSYENFMLTLSREDMPDFVIDLTSANDANGAGSRVIALNTVSDMQAASWLKVGQRVKTAGYASAGGGGGNEYEIVAAGTGINDGGSIIDLPGSGLQARGLFPASAVNVKQFGAAGDNSTDDSAAVQSAVTFAGATSAEVRWPAGTYVTSASIDGFHAVQHLGEGIIKRGSDLFYVDQFGQQQNTLYVSASGSASNDGLSASEPFDSGQSAVDVWKKYAAAAKGKWVISLGAGTYSEGIEIDQVRSHYELIIDGGDKALTVLDGASAVKANGINFNSGARGRVRNLTVKNFSSNGIAFQNESIGVIDSCDVTDCGNFGMNASDGCQLKILGACVVRVPAGGQGVRYYQNSQGSVGDGVNTITIDGQGNIADGLIVRNGSEVICNHNLVIDNCQNLAVWLFRCSFLEFRTTTISNSAIGIKAAQLSIYVDSGLLLGGPADITFSGNAKNLDVTGFSHRSTDTVNTAIGHDGPSPQLPSSNYDLVLSNNGQTGYQVLSNGNAFNLDVNETERVVFDTPSERLRFYGGGNELMQLRDDPSGNKTAATLLVNDGTTTSLRQVVVGAADSGGAGYRLLRVQN